jgi:hypothetical protein
MLWVGHRLREPAVELGATITHLARVGLLRGKDCCTPTPEGTPEGTPTHNPLKLHLIHPPQADWPSPPSITKGE